VSVTPIGGKRTPVDQRWRAYLDWFHEQRPGITEGVLARSAGDSGLNPYQWLLETVPADVRVLEVACGSGPLLAARGGRRWVGIDRSVAELERAAGRTTSPVVQGEATGLPFPDRSFDAVVCSMALMLFRPVDTALGEIARVLGAGGTGHFLLPGSFPLTARDRLRYLRMLAVLRQPRPAFPNRIHMVGLHRQLRRAGFEVLRDDRVCFCHPIDDVDDAKRFVESLYTPGRRGDRLDRAGCVAASWVGSGIGIPLRRVVCQK